MAANQPEPGRVTTERRGHVFLIGLNRVAKRNAFDTAMFQAIGSAYAELEHDPELRCGVLFAHGDHFTGGLDLANVAPDMDKGVIADLKPGTLDPYGLHEPRLTKPLICAVQGICLTVGIELLLSSDIRIAASNVRFAQIEVKRGLYPSGGPTIRFVREAGWGNAMRYLLTGDDFNAQEAMRMGLVQEIVEPGQQLARALEFAEKISAQAPLAVYTTLAASRRALLEGETAAVGRLHTDQQPLLQTEDFKEGVQSFIERRTANFKGR